MEVLRVEHLTKIYGKGENEVKALDNVSFTIEQGEFVAIIGPSGSGKSTMLHMLGGVDKPTRGKVFVGGQDVYAQNEEQLAVFRRRKVGLIYQFYNLIPNLTVLENVELAGQIVKQSKPAEDILKQVGLEHRMNNFPSQISGGEQQRVAIARAIAKNPQLLLCDEPTGALDYKTGKNILNILKEYCKNEKRTVIIITHNSSIAQAADKVIEIYDAKVKKVFVNQNPKNIDEIEW